MLGDVRLPMGAAQVRNSGPSALSCADPVLDDIEALHAQRRVRYLTLPLRLRSMRREAGATDGALWNVCVAAMTSLG
jgi:hypothetical protein